MPSLTPKQKKIFAFIEETEKQKGSPPTFREIQKHFGFSSLGTVYSHIQTLKKKKALQGGRYISIEIAKESGKSGLVNLAIIGEVMQGHPPKMWNEPISYPIPESFIINESSAYLFLVKGETLQHELIDDEDLLVVQAGVAAEEGDSVFALFAGGVLIKTYFKEGKGIRLESKSRQVPPLFFEEDSLLIQGVITAVIRPLI